MKIRVVGFNGTAAIIWVAAVQTMDGKLIAGAQCAVTSRSLKRIVRLARSIVVADRDKRCCTGLTIRERSDCVIFQVVLLAKAANGSFF
jgi:hypothetical protein